MYHDRHMAVIDKDFVLSYWQEYVTGFIFSDIENSIKATANFTVAQALMSYTEFMGALINGHLGETGHSHDDFNRFLKYLSWNGNDDYYSNFKIKYKEGPSTREKSVDIYTAFRCGLVHEYLPKLPSIVHNNPLPIKTSDGRVVYCVDEDAGIGWIDHDGRKVLRFHNNAYFRDYKKAVDRVFRQIFVQNDPGITAKVEKSLARVFSRELKSS
jgi:hypothetical protein